VAQKKYGLTPIQKKITSNIHFQPLWHLQCPPNQKSSFFSIFVDCQACFVLLGLVLQIWDVTVRHVEFTWTAP
jgi:hypothetical protein